jgi:hypothetical protein
MPQQKKKKQPKNAFYFFMLQFRNQEEAKGAKFPGGLKEVAEKAAPIWNVRKFQDCKDRVKGKEKHTTEYPHYKRFR